MTARTREADSRPSLILAGGIVNDVSSRHCIPRVSTDKHVQRQQGPKKGSRALYPDGIPWRHLSALSPACVRTAARVCFVDKLRPIINRYKMEAVHNIGILFRGFTAPP